MGRTVTAERSLEGILKSLLLSQSGRSRLKTAVLVGHIVSESRDHLLSVIPTPEYDEQTNRTETDIELVSQHVQQVYEMLTGGIEVLGLAVSVSVAQTKSLQSTLKKLLLSVWKSSQDIVEEWVEFRGCSHQLMVFYQMETKKVRYMCLDMMNPATSLQAASDIKFMPNPLAFCCVEATIHCELHKILHKRTIDTAQTLKDVIKQTINNILTCVAVIDGQIPHNSELIGKFQSKHPRKSSPVIVELLYHLPEISEKKLECIEQGTEVKMRNVICCRAYVSHTTSWSDTIKALRFDAIKSLVIRQNLLLDELILLSEDQSCDQLLLARRVWVIDNSLSFSLSEYCSVEEMEEDVKERVYKVWGKERELVIHNAEEVEQEQEEKEKKELKTGVGVSLYTVAGVLVLVVGLILSLVSFLYQ